MKQEDVHLKMKRICNFFALCRYPGFQIGVAEENLGEDDRQ